jgi:hypothetical protein
MGLHAPISSIHHSFYVKIRDFHVGIKITFFLDVIPCGLVVGYYRLGGNCCLHFQGICLEVGVWYIGIKGGKGIRAYTDIGRIFTWPLYE